MLLEGLLLFSFYVNFTAGNMQLDDGTNLSHLSLSFLLYLMTLINEGVIFVLPSLIFHTILGRHSNPFLSLGRGFKNAFVIEITIQYNEETHSTKT